VAESNKFGNPRTQFGDAPSTEQADDGLCAQCEAMLTDALDGTLSAADQAIFDTHMAGCGPCTELLTQAKRGLAWLEMLRDPQPEPPASLVPRILEQTSGLLPVAATDGSPAIAGRRPVLPFRQRAWAAIRQSGIGQIALQPRLAMTAAMAFFSVALTMDITGTRLQDLSPSNLRPSNLKRTFYSANARVVHYYENLRVVYELESRVSDLETVRGDDRQSAPAARPATSQPVTQPDNRQSNPGSDAAPEKKGNTSHGGRSGMMRREQPDGRNSAVRFRPERAQLAALDGRELEGTLEIENGTATGADRWSRTAAKLREGRLV